MWSQVLREHSREYEGVLLRDRKEKPAARAREFSAILERQKNNLQWVVIRVPLNVARTWGVRGQLRVKGEINGFAFRTTLFPDGNGGHVMVVNKAMQKGSDAAPGVSARFRMEPDTEERKAEMPAEMLRELRQDRGLHRYFESLSPSTRREIGKYIAEAKSAEVRTQRAERMAERLMTAMDGERGELPPILQQALARYPEARLGWEAMPKSQRRFHLLGISGYRSPESRARRVEKAIQAMLCYAERARQRKKDAE